MLLFMIQIILSLNELVDEVADDFVAEGILLLNAISNIYLLLQLVVLEGHPGDPLVEFDELDVVVLGELVDFVQYCHHTVHKRRPEVPDRERVPVVTGARHLVLLLVLELKELEG